MEKVQTITGFTLSEITASQEFIIRKQASQEFIIRKQCLEHDNYMLREHIMAKQGMA